MPKNVFHPPDKAQTNAPNNGLYLISRFLERDLVKLSEVQTWFLLIGCESVITVADALMRPSGILIAPSYLFPICLACWRLGLAPGLVIVTLSTGCATLVSFMVNSHLTTPAILGNLLTNISVLSAIAVIIASFRYCYDQQRHLASHDRTTGTLNRTAFYDRLEETLNVARAANRFLLLFYLDLDGFKAVNDRFGHDAGDEVLQVFAAEAIRVLRREDCLGRMGGDEFVGVIQTSSSDDALKLAESLHKRFSAVLGESGYAVTCSMGALIVPPDYHFTSMDLMKRADKLMYEAKRNGKNMICLASVFRPSDPSRETHSPL